MSPRIPYPRSSLNIAISAVSICSTLLSPLAFAKETVQQLPVIQVTASADESSEQSKSYIVENSGSATKLNIPLQETPQTVNVVTQQQIQDFGLNEIRDVLSNTPGVYVSSQETDRTTYTSRGFNISNQQIDGYNLPLMGSDYFVGAIDMAIYDRVEVSKGANAITSAVGSPSATVNYIRKRPTDTLQANFNASYGSWDNQRYEGDVSGAILPNGKVRGRLMAAYDTGDSYLDNYSHETNVVAGLVEADLTDSTLLTIGHTEQKHKPNSNNWGALPMLDADGQLIEYDRSYNPMPDWVYWDSETQNSFVELQQKIGNNWSIHAHYSHNELKDHGALLYFVGNPSSDGTGISNYPSTFSETFTTKTADIHAKGSVPLFNQNHELVLGYTWSESDVEQLSYFIPTYTTPISDWWSYDSNTLSYPTFSLTNSADYQLKQKSTYLASRIHFNDDLKLLMGANYTQATAKGQSYGAPYNYDQDEVVPYTGLTYNITPEYTLYGSYAEVFLPTNRFDINQLVLDPIEGKTWELGVKSSWLDGTLTGSFAYFNNAFEGFPITTGVRLANNQTAYRPQNIESDGFELNLAGQITDEINTSFGFVHLRHMRDSDTQEDVRTFVPLDTINLLTTYQPSLLPKLKLGMGLQYVGDTSYSANENLRQDDYILLNAMASYEVNPHMTIQANGNNLTNEKYLNSLEYGQSFYGEPANYTVALKFKY